MNTEHQIIFPNIEKDDIRERLRKVGAEKVKEEFLMKRTVFNFPEGHGVPGGWIRIRDEGEKVTLTIKMVNGNGPERIDLIVDNAAQAQAFLETMGATKAAYCETKREIWSLDGITAKIDEWPFLEPILKIRAKDEATARNAVSWLGLDYGSAKICKMEELYSNKYSGAAESINDKMKNLAFDVPNPFEV